MKIRLVEADSTIVAMHICIDRQALKISLNMAVKK